MIFKISTVVELYYILYKFTTLTTVGYTSDKYKCGQSSKFIHTRHNVGTWLKIDLKPYKLT